MPESLPGVSQFLTTPVSIPVPGEAAGMQTGPAPMKPLFQQLVDNDAFNLTANASGLDWNGELSVAPGGSLTSFSITVGQISAIVLAVSGGYKVRASGVTTIGASKVEGGGATLGASSQWWYVYAFDSGSGVDFEISTTAPSTPRRAKQGDATRRYLGCFRTDGSGAPFPMRMVRGRCLYRRAGILNVTAALGSNGLRAVSESLGTAVVNVDLSSRIPPHARVALLHAELYAGSAGTAGINELKLYTADDTTVAAARLRAVGSSAAGDGSFNSASFEIETTAARFFAYDTDKNTDVIEANVDVMGWLE